MEIEFDDIIIEWDDDKAEKNIRKHKVYFEDAARIFYDNNRYEVIDEEHSQYEIRYKTIGIVKGIMVVIYTERGEKIRLISARKANKEEVKKYYGQFKNL